MKRHKTVLIESRGSTQLWPGMLTCNRSWGLRYGAAELIGAVGGVGACVPCPTGAVFEPVPCGKPPPNVGVRGTEVTADAMCHPCCLVGGVPPAALSLCFFRCLCLRCLVGLPSRRESASAKLASAPGCTVATGTSLCILPTDNTHVKKPRYQH